MLDLGTSVFVRTTSFRAPVQGGCIAGVNKMVVTSHVVATIVLCYLTDSNLKHVMACSHCPSFFQK